MKKVLVVSLIVLASLLFANAVPANARGLMNERFASIGYGIFKPGDDSIKDIDDSITAIIAQVNIPMNERVDLNFSFSQQKLEGTDPIGDSYEVTSDAIGISAYYTLESKLENMKPYIFGGLSRVSSDVNATIGGLPYSDEQTDTGYNIGLGLEKNLTASAAATASISYETIDSESDIGVNVFLNNWFTDTLGAVLGAGYYTDDGDMLFHVAVTIGF